MRRSRPDDRGIVWKNTFKSVATLAADRLPASIDPTWGKLAGIWHDLGKYAPDWQAFIRAAGERAVDAHVEEADNESRRVRGPDHSTAGAIHAVETMGRELGAPVAFAISGHHAGMPDENDLRERLRKADKRDRHAASLSRAPQLITAHPSAPSWPDWLHGIGDHAARQRSFEFFTRMLFAALVDADFLDTERYFGLAGDRDARAHAAVRDNGWPTLPEYRRGLHEHLSRIADAAPDSTVSSRGNPSLCCPTNRQPRTSA